MALSRERTKLIRRLRNPRQRSREGSFLVEGVRAAGEFLKDGSRAKPRFAILSPRLSLTRPGLQLEKSMRESGLPMEDVGDAEMDDLSDTEQHQGVLMVVEEPPNTLSTLRPERHSRFLILDGIQDPGNAGALVRVAWAFGLQGVICLEGTADPFGPKVVRASAGAVAHVPVLKTPWAEAEGWMRKNGLPLLLADLGGTDVRGFSPPDGWVLALGNEGVGPREALKAGARATLTVPMVPGVDSLNAGLAGAILLFSLVGHPCTGMEN